MLFVRKNRNQAVRSQGVRLLRYAVVFALLTGIVSSGLFSATGTIVAADAASEGAGYTSDQLEALNFLNEVRSRAGVPSVQLSATITKAAIAHAEFYNTNKSDLPGLSAHSEISGRPGYTGKSAFERMTAAGWVSGARGYSYGEVMYFGQTSGKAAIQAWLDTAYHRSIILDPGFTEIGIAIVGGTAVLDAGGPGESQQAKVGITVYPYDQQTNVPVGFYGGEIPDPLSQFAIEHSGYIISAHTDKDLTSHTAKITDETGTEIPYYEEVKGDDLYIFPKPILKGNHRYTVSLEYQVEGSADSLKKVWSFTTGKGHALTGLTPAYTEIVLNEGGQFQLQVEGGYDDGTTELLPGSEVKYAVKQNKGLTVSSTGTISGDKSGDYLLTVSSGSVSSQVKVKVYPKLKTKVYPATDPGKLTDIKGNKALPAIEWALKTGVMTEASKGLFKPEAAVSEAEFWTMLLRAYNVNIEAYQPAKIRHWADTAYLIAKDRNFPLNGLSNVSARDSRITRLKIAEIIAAADGLNVKNNDAVKLVLGKDYVRCETELSISGYQGGKWITRAEAAQILQYLRPKLTELRGRPVSATPSSSLPALPPKQVYVEPLTLEDRTFFAKFNEDHKLTIKGKFTQFAGQTLKLQVQTGIKPLKVIDNVSVTLDSEGKFQIDCGPYEQEALNLYLVTPKGRFYLNIQYKTMNYTKYSSSYNA
ncbi:S-layer homology domain-containing protein [Paenibacillus sp. HN-1]|uniref:CAP and S-layer homology domain-containing protein n=1 Tax=Paenibacillus TaxID=44249 RepID=UPI001CA824AB|nr:MULTISPECIES: CAP domain-containing protein [Paenibacillus]MBY9079208.1 S-layer homology domain-containing protein [Paenibacillus sp. CGMCC 1.18879]MBY9087371.1 S-layer homology domain-containing protein [Paenibacillus sinensis]